MKQCSTMAGDNEKRSLLFVTALYIYTYQNMHLIKAHIFLLSLLLAINCSPVFSQDSIQTESIRMRQLTVDDGLSQGFVYDGLQDKAGFLWFTTMDGLNRFDGYNFKVYKHDDDNPYSLPENTIYSIAEDEKGNLWISTINKGLYIMNRETERFYPVPIMSTLIPGNDYYIRKLVCKQNLLYIKTLKGMVVANIAKVQLANYTAQQLKQQVQVIANIPMTSDDEGQDRIMADHSIINCGYGNLELFVADKTHTNWTKKVFTAKDFGLKSIDFNTRFLLLPSTNSLFVIHDGSIFLYDLLKQKNVFQRNYGISITNNIRLIDHKIYFTDNGKDPVNTLFEFDLATHTLKSWRPQNNIRLLMPLFKDRTGCVWVRTDADGVAILNKQLFAFKTVPDFGRFVYGGKNMIAYNKGEILEYAPSTPGLRKIATAKEFNPGNNLIYSTILFDKKGIIWRTGGANFNLLIAYDTLTKQCKEYDLGFKVITHLFKDNMQHLWVFHKNDDTFMDNYLTCLDSLMKPIVPAYKFPERQMNEDSRFLMAQWQDENNILWLATDAGLFSLDPKQTDEKKVWKHWKNIRGDNSSLSSDKLISLCPDPKEPQKYLWLGTQGDGFNRFEMATGKCTRYTDKNGLANNVAYDILPDEFGNLWISTNMGLSCFTTPNKMYPNGKFRNFSVEDGIAGNEFNRLSGKKTGTGELFFRAVKGVTWFNPSEVLQQQDTVPINFVALSVNNKILEWEKNPSVIAGDIAYLKQVSLSHDQNIFSISFSSMDFRNTKGKMYSWYLEGFDKDWTEPSQQHVVTYTNLDPGTYTFHVKGTNTDAVWNEKDASIKIIILPAWYQTWWFKVLVIVLLSVILYSLYRFRLQQLLKMEGLRNRIASDLHDEIGSTLSSISLYGESAKKLVPGNNMAEKILSKINNSTAEMMEAMSDIVWAVNTKNDRFDNLANRMRSFAVQLTETKNISLHFTENENIPNFPFNMVQRKNVYLIFKEAVNNAVKYSNCNNLWIAFTGNHHLLTITIRDDGNGFIYDETAGDKNISFGGNGIRNMKNRAAEIKATLNITSALNEGTSIILKLYLRKS
ncbi:MAG: two-component regulator propeller domain-containing protein [Ferruginibacter sp.]